MKKLTALFLATLTLFCFTACAQPQVAEPHEASKQPEPTVEPTPEPTIIPTKSEKWQEYDRVVYDLAAGGNKNIFINKSSADIFNNAYGFNWSEDSKQRNENRLNKLDVRFTEGDEWWSMSDYPRWGGRPTDFTVYDFLTDLNNKVYGINKSFDEQWLANVYPSTDEADVMGREYVTINESDYYYMTIGITSCMTVDNFNNTKNCLLYKEYAELMKAYIDEKEYDRLAFTDENEEYLIGLYQARNEALVQAMKEYDISKYVEINEINNIAYPMAYTAVEILKEVEEEYNRAWEEKHGNLDAANYQLAIKDISEYRAKAQYEVLKDIIDDINSRGGDVYIAYDSEISYYLYQGYEVYEPIDKYYIGGGIVELGKMLNIDEQAVDYENCLKLYDTENYSYNSVLAQYANYSPSYLNLVYGSELKLNGFLPASAFKDYETLCELLLDDGRDYIINVGKGYTVCLTDCMDFEAKYLGKRLKDITPITQEQAQEYVAGVKEHFANTSK